MTRFIEFLYKLIKPLSRVVNYIGIVALAIMMFLTAVDVILRKSVNMPIIGSYEIIDFTLLTCAAFGLAYCAIEKKHITVDVVTACLSKRAQAILGCITGLFALAMVIILTWQEIHYMNILMESKQLSTVLLLPLYPFVGILAFSLALYCFILVIHLLEYVSQAINP